MQHLNKVSTLEGAAFVRGTRTCQSRRLPYGKLAPNEAALFGCRSYTFLKIEQLNKVSTLEVVQLVRDDARRTIREFAFLQTRSVFQPRYFSG